MEIGEHIAVQNEEVMVTKCVDKKLVSFMCTIHCKSIVVRQKPNDVQDRNSFMGGVDLKDQT
jgi:hypothetical protein